MVTREEAIKELTRREAIKELESRGISLEQPQEKGFTSRVGEDINKRLEASKTATDLPNFLMSSARIGVGIPSDIGGEILKSGYNVLPQGIKQPIEKGVSYALQKANQANEDITPYIPGLKSYQEAVSTSMKNPTVANAVGLTSELPMGAIATKAMGIIPEKGLGLLRKGVNEVSDNAFEAATKRQITKAAQDKALANRLYGISEQADIQFAPENLTKLNDNLSKLAPKTDAGRRVWNKSEASKYVQDLQDTMKVEPLTLNGALEQRNSLNSRINVAFKSGDSAEAKNLMKVKDALDETMTNPETGAWQEANHVWGQASTKQDLEDMIKVAQDKAQPANSLDTAISNYLRKKGKSLPETEQKALRDVIEGGAFKELGKNLGTRLLSHAATVVGGGIGGVPGAVAGNLIGTYGSAFARDVAMTNKLNKLDKVFEIIDSRPMKTIKPSVSEVMKMPPKQALETMNKYSGAK